MVTAVSTTTTNLNPKRRPLFPSEAENGQPRRRPKSKEVSSRYLSSSSSKTSSSISSTSKQREAPNVTRTGRSSPAIRVQDSATVSRSQSVGRRRPAGTSEMSAATKLLLTSTRSKSVSFQGESNSLVGTKAKPVKKFANRIDTSERKRSEKETEKVNQMNNAKRIAPGRTKPANSSLNKGAVTQMERPVKDKMESARAIDKLRLLERSKSVNSSLMARSLDCGKYPGTFVSGNIVRLSQKSVTGEINQFNDEPLREDVPIANLNSSYGSAEEVACDSESVSSGSGSSGQECGSVVSQLRGRHSIVRSVRVLQQENGRTRRGAEPNSPVSRNNGYTTLAPSKQIDNKKSLNENRVSSFRDILATRGFSPYIRGHLRSGSPSKTSTPSTSYPLRGNSNPARATIGAVITTPNNVGNTPSTLSFGTDVRGKAGENLFADVHEFRLLYNRHLQWRFVNAKTDSAYCKLTETAERNLYNAQLATSKLLHSVKSKQTELLLLKQNLKLYRILKGQVPCFENWGLIDKEHCSSLSAAICALEADIQKLKSAICSAVNMVQTMASSICLLQSKVEQMSSLLIELSNTVSSEHSSLDQCRDLLSTVTDMQVKQCSLMTHLLQLKDPQSCSTQL
ncbi:QWRF motif-containing protein 2-like isoform X2 [Ipomoea triloba]|uniref:QWRF motif-containing protein 2-like isoform X2 n=1 Tax=Ipomoea triloba TaxID=35885 RepID=UPI00125DFE0B|nr:QWRF motif-containing protein 2-like isoform X2 [Ipomoea triloba]